MFRLIAEYRRLSGEDPPVIVGSQAFHAASDVVPEIARRSIECDFLLSGSNFSKRPHLDAQLGALSEYQAENGFFADVLGAATVVLPDGWEKRLIPLIDEDGLLAALCADPYDVCVAKFVAGRAKDLEFLESALAGELITLDPLLDRIEQVRGKVENNVIKDRLSRLKDFLEAKRIHRRAVDALRVLIAQ